LCGSLFGGGGRWCNKKNKVGEAFTSYRRRGVILAEKIALAHLAEEDKTR